MSVIDSSGQIHTKSSSAVAAEVIIRFHLPTSHEVLASDVTLSVPLTKSSSSTNGIATANENGQPTTAPVANASVARSVRRMLSLLGGSSAYAKAKVFAYMTNDEGRNAAA